MADNPRILNYDGANPMETYETIQKLCKHYNDAETSYVSMPVITIYGYEKDVFVGSDFSDVVYKTFEGFELPVPVGYDRILRTTYGNYMEFPPVEKRGKWHFCFNGSRHTL